MFKDTNIIFTYTRKEAIEDGVQFLATGELAKIAKRYYKYPLYITNSVHCFIESEVEKLKDKGADYVGILADILFDSIQFPHKISPSLVKFKVPPNEILYIQCGPTDIDDPTPCLTLMTEMDL